MLKKVILYWALLFYTSCQVNDLVKEFEHAKPGLYNNDGSEHNIYLGEIPIKQSINIIDHGVDIENNSFDDAIIIQKVIDDATYGTEIYFPNGIYNLTSEYQNCNTHLFLKNGIVLRGESRSGTIFISDFPTEKNRSELTSIVKLSGINDVIINNITFSSNFNGKFSTDIVDNNPDRDGIVYGIFVSDRNKVSSSNIIIDNVIVENFQKMGVRIQASKDVIVRNSLFKNATDVGNGGAGYGVVIQGRKHGQNNFRKENDSCYNLVENCQFLGPFIRHGVLLQYYTHNNLIRNNYFNNTGLYAIDLHGEDEFLNEIAGNSINNNLKTGAIRAGNIGAKHDKTGPYNYIHHNNIKNCFIGIRVWLGTPNTIIEYNNIYEYNNGSRGIGIQIQNAPNTIVKNNLIHDNLSTGYSAILLNWDKGTRFLVGEGIPKNILIESNTISNNDYGILIREGEDIQLINNDVFNNRKSDLLFKKISKISQISRSLFP